MKKYKSKKKKYADGSVVSRDTKVSAPDPLYLEAEAYGQRMVDAKRYKLEGKEYKQYVGPIPKNNPYFFSGFGFLLSGLRYLYPIINQ